MTLTYDVGDFVKIKLQTSTGNKIFQIKEAFRFSNTYRLDNNIVYNYSELLLVETKEDSLDRLEKEEEQKTREKLKQVIDFFV